MATMGEEALLLEMTLKSKTWIWSWKSPVRCSCQKAERLWAAKTFRHSGEAVLPLTSFLLKHALTNGCRKGTIKASPDLLNPERPSIYSILYTGWTVLPLNYAMHPTGWVLICFSIFTAFFSVEWLWIVCTSFMPKIIWALATQTVFHLSQCLLNICSPRSGTPGVFKSFL